MGGNMRGNPGERFEPTFRAQTLQRLRGEMVEMFERLNVTKMSRRVLKRGLRIMK